MLALAAVAGVVLVVWLLLSVLPLYRFPRHHFLRAVRPPATAASAPRVAVLVPARDEAAVLPATLPALLRQEYPSYAIVLIDDGSTDGTDRVARELAAGEAVTIVPAGLKPPGWAGKMHALAHGLETVLERAEPGAGDPARAPAWLLLTDADVLHPPSSLASLVAKAQRGGYDLVSVMARLSTVGGWERLLVPPFVFFFHLLYPFRAVVRRGGGTAAAAGGCILVRTQALVDAGGFAALRDALIDDVALAKLLKTRRRRLWLGLDPAIESVRRYGLRDLWRMVARSAFVQLGYRYSLVPAVVAGLAVFFVGPPLLLAAGALAIASGGATGTAALTVALAAAAWLLETRALRPWVRHHRVAPATGWALLFPAAAALYAAMTVSSAWDHLRGRGSAWKGRGYDAPRSESTDTFSKR